MQQLVNPFFFLLRRSYNPFSKCYITTFQLCMLKVRGSRDWFSVLLFKIFRGKSLVYGERWPHYAISTVMHYIELLSNIQNIQFDNDDLRKMNCQAS